nr:hypothetical protein [Paraburkholderia humisilvae]
MEHLVRVLNDRDRQTLVWLRKQLGDAAVEAALNRIGGPTGKPYLSALCKELGVRIPRVLLPEPLTPTPTPTPVAEQSLAAIRTLLASKPAKFPHGVG